MKEAMLINSRNITIRGLRCETYVAFSKLETKKRKISEKNKRVFIGNLNPKTDNVRLKEYFEGLYKEKVMRAYVMVDGETHESKGFGF